MEETQIDSSEMIGIFCLSDGCSENLDVQSAQAYAYLQQGIHKLEEGLYHKNLDLRALYALPNTKGFSH